MSECICASCAHLKSVADEAIENENHIVEICEYGFPSEDCSECDVDGCDLTCDHYVRESIVDIYVITKCAQCGQEVKHHSKSNEESLVYCMDCYLDQ